MSRFYWQRIALRLGMFLGFIAVTFGAGTALLLWTRSEPPLEITQKLAAARPWLLVWRLLVFGALIGFWPGFCRCVARWRGLKNDQLARLLQARWHPRCNIKHLPMNYEPADTCQGMCGREWRGDVLAGRRSSSHGYHKNLREFLDYRTAASAPMLGSA